VLANVAGAATLTAAVVRGLRFDAAAGLRALRAASTCASDLAELIVREGGVDYRTAHALVGRLSRSGDARDGAAHLPSVAEIDDAARSLLGRPLVLAPDALARALDPALAVARRAGRGGAAPGAVVAMIAECRGRLSEHASRVAGASARCSRSERDLLDVARRLASAR
jgi:argininosuccinate lyase